MFLSNLTMLNISQHLTITSTNVNNQFSNLTYVYWTMGHCSAPFPDWNFSIYDGRYYNLFHDRVTYKSCATHKPFTTVEYFRQGVHLPFIYYSGPVSNPFGSIEAIGSCQANKLCAHDRIYANVDECRAYASKQGRSYWLQVEQQVLTSMEIHFICAICNADGETFDYEHPVENDFEFVRSDVCSLPPPPSPPPSSPPSPQPPSPPPSCPPPSSGNSSGLIVGATIGGVVGLGLLVAAVAWLKSAVRTPTLSGGFTGANSATPTLKRFPATFEVNMDRAQTARWSRLANW